MIAAELGLLLLLAVVLLAPGWMAVLAEVVGFLHGRHDRRVAARAVATRWDRYFESGGGRP